MNKLNFEKMQDTARQIENLALLLRAAAESGELYNMGEDVTGDTAAMIQEKARDLGMMIQQAKDTARDIPTA